MAGPSRSFTERVKRVLAALGIRGDVMTTDDTRVRDFRVLDGWADDGDAKWAERLAKASERLFDGTLEVRGSDRLWTLASRLATPDGSTEPQKPGPRERRDPIKTGRKGRQSLNLDFLDL